MLGAIIGDIAGSRFEWNRIKTKEFEFFDPACCFTDDSVLSFAVARAILDAHGDEERLGECAVKNMRGIGRLYPDAGYGGMFRRWLYDDDMGAYTSFGNGAAMRVSPCGFAAKTLDEARRLSKIVTEVTHNHPEGLRGAEAAAVCVFLAREGKSKSDIRSHADTHYYPMDFTLDAIRDAYRFDETCQGTVPQAIMAFLESDSFEDAIRNAVSLGGDSDTLAAITGGIAGAHYGIPPAMRARGVEFLDERLRTILRDFEAAYPREISEASPP
ncbi:MAG: ADP-ribosylglycohydrolase family protein [Spirochaetota bacterium]|jgi:type I restriction enzyme M protein|nr:ADP-ribosylglycohydrolase family protein [Spirochaetota bacterium]